MLILVAAAVLFLGVFVVHQRRATTVMVEPRLFRRPALISVLALSENDQF
ncbi:hypothetical protein [Pseudonocardia parietis]|uniref:Uncharacterized protein n=1 Tax=Pseudonocardia parietis TaxID=570936 RepID=A0ABS4W6A1_9PSEU|nr:hypothetical protein [Pseudonocardia parietis]MBP2371643.1 hypothetical protein [Pseudonocardia parietis]